MSAIKKKVDRRLADVVSRIGRGWKSVQTAKKRRDIKQERGRKSASSK